MQFLEFLLRCLYFKKHTYGISWGSSKYLIIVKFYNMNNKKYYDQRIEELYRECDNLFPKRYSSSTASKGKIRFRNKLNKLVASGYLQKGQEYKHKGISSIRVVPYKLLNIPEKMEKKYLSQFCKRENTNHASLNCKEDILDIKISNYLFYEDELQSELCTPASSSLNTEQSGIPINASLNGREDILGKKNTNDVFHEDETLSGLCTLGSGSPSTEQSVVPIDVYGSGREVILEKNSPNFYISAGDTLPVQESTFPSDITMEDVALNNSFEDFLEIHQIDNKNVCYNTSETELDFDGAKLGDLNNPENSCNIDDLLEFILEEPMSSNNDPMWSSCWK